MQRVQPKDLSKFEFNDTYAGKTYQYVMTGIVMKNLYKYWGVLSPAQWAMTLTAATIQPAAELTGSKGAKTLAGYTALGLSFVLNPITAGISFAAHTVSNEFLEVGWENLPDYIRNNWLGHEAFALAHICKNEGIAYGVRKYEEYKQAQEDQKNQPPKDETKDTKDNKENIDNANDNKDNKDPGKTDEPQNQDKPKTDTPTEQPPADKNKQKHKHKHKHKHKFKYRDRNANNPRKPAEQLMQDALDQFTKKLKAQAAKPATPKPAPTPAPAPSQATPESKINDLLKKGYRVYKHVKRNGKGHTQGAHMNADEAAAYMKAGGELEFKKPGSKIWMKENTGPAPASAPAKPATNANDLKKQLSEDIKKGIHSRSQIPPKTPVSKPSAASMKIDELSKEGYRFYKNEGGTVVRGHMNPNDAKAYIQAGGKVECKKVGASKISLSEQSSSSSNSVDETTLSAIKQTHAMFFGKPYKKKQIAPQPVVQPNDAPDNPQNNPPATGIPAEPAPLNPVLGAGVIPQQEEPIINDQTIIDHPALVEAADEHDDDEAQTGLLIEQGDVCHSELTASSASDDELGDEQNDNVFTSDDEEGDEEQNALVAKIETLFGELRSKINFYQELTTRVKHGMYAGELPVNFREMNECLSSMERGEKSFKEGIKSIVEISKHNKVINSVALRCFNLINGNNHEYKR